MMVLGVTSMNPRPTRTMILLANRFASTIIRMSIYRLLLRCAACFPSPTGNSPMYRGLEEHNPGKLTKHKNSPNPKSGQTLALLFCGMNAHGFIALRLLDPLLSQAIMSS